LYNFKINKTTQNLKKYFTEKELQFMWKTIGDNCNPVFDKGTEKQKFTLSTMDKIKEIAIENNYI
tara:strand:+ start:2841 stop:3035 length:195 start_codon:yes stop_codon:yes gene_type:complete